MGAGLPCRDADASGFARFHPSYEGVARRKTQTCSSRSEDRAGASRRAIAATYRGPAPLSLHLAPLPGLDHV